ncbi:MAG: translation initiation factor IF-2 [Spirochaetia bacterium]|nr:translation initiation factor IF-2 [Spirochaetia bacterium]
MEKPKKKKLVLKKSGKGGSIAQKIANRQSKDAAYDKKVRPPIITKPPKKVENLREQPRKPYKPNQKKEEKFPSEEKIVQKPEKPVSKKKVEGKKKHDKGYLRENILKREEHKKFFLKHQSESPERKSFENSAYSSIPKEISITEYIQVGELARKMNVKTSDLITKLMHLGVMATITQSIDADTASLAASEYGCHVNVISLYEETIIKDEIDEDSELEIRPPVVTVMGHVDHGKTKLLDALRKTDQVALEAGGITQHIGAYQVQTPKGKITFLDTPGHEAFTAMRARGAQVTDIVVLVVAADDGIMPQTIEAIHHAKDANVPIIVAINKIDVMGANPEKIKQALTQYELVPEEWGGNTPIVEVSALKGINLDKLEDIILTTAEIKELKASHSKKAVGTVVEAKLDQGRGPIATVLVTNGKLKQGDPFVVGLVGGRVRAMVSDRGTAIKEATPSTPVEILGLTGVPNAGDSFHVMDSEKAAKEIMEKRQELSRREQAQQIKKVKLENLNEIIEEGKSTEFKIIIKADVRGSVEALQTSLEKLSSKEVKISVIFGGTGEITESDVMLASAANAVIIGFGTRANARVREIASKEGVEIKYYNIIYQAIDDIKLAISGMLSPEINEENTGEAQVRELYKISGLGTICGCMVTNGIIERSSGIRVIREGKVIYDGKIKTLKRFKDDVSEVKEGFECGILIDGYNDVKQDDILEVYKKVEKLRSFDDIKKDEPIKEKPGSEEESSN